MKRIILAFTVALTMAFSSCGLYTKYEAESTVDETLYGDKVSALSHMLGADTTHMMGNVSWREIFTDPVLQGLIDQALEQNNSLRTAVLNVENAKTALKVSRLAYVPSVAATGSFSTSGLVTGGSTESYTVGVTASWEVDIFGKLRNEKERAKMVAEQTELVEQAIRSQVVASTANLYYTMGMLDQQILIARKTLISWEESLVTARSLKEAGYMTDAGVSQIQAGLYGVMSSLADLEQARSESQNAMCSILAIAPQTIEVAALAELTLPREISLGVPMQMLSSRPDVMAAEAALAASFYSENAARAAFYPSITLSGTLGWTNALGGAILDPAEFMYNILASAVQPIFSRGLNKAQLEIAKNTVEQNRIAFEQTLLESGFEVNNALVLILNSTAKSEFYTRQVESLRSAAASTSLLMEHGSTTYLEVLTAQQSYFNAQLQQVSNTYSQTQGVISLYNAMGGGRFN